MKEKIKKISKYTMNLLAMLNAIIIGLSPIWDWQLGKITDSISVLIGIIGLYLVGGKIFEQEPFPEHEDAGEDLDD